MCYLLWYTWTFVNCSFIFCLPLQSKAMSGSQMRNKMAIKSDSRKLPTVADTRAKLDTQQQLLSSREDRELNSAVAVGQIDHSLMKKMIPEKNKTFKNTGSLEILQNVQNSLSSSPMSSLGADYNNLSGSGAHTSSSANMRSKKTAGQGETVTAKASPVTVRKEQTAAQSERPGKASPATTRKEQIPDQSGRTTGKGTPATMRIEQTAAQGERPGKANPATTRKEQIPDQSETTTGKDTPATMRIEQTAAQGERPGKATPATTRKEQISAQGERTTGKDTSTTTRKQISAQGERTTGKTGPAAIRKEQNAVQSQRTGKATPTTAKKEPISTQGGERTTAKSNPTSMRVEQSKNLSGGNAAADPNLKITAPAKPARSSKVKSKPGKAMQGHLEQNRGMWVNPNAEHKQLPEHAEIMETAGKLTPPTPPSAKLKPRPPPFFLQEPSQTEPKGEEVEGFIVAADLESPPESPKAKPDNVIARQLSEQAEEEGIFYKEQESVRAKSPEDAYTAELLADPKLRQLHDMFPGEQVSHLQKLLEENKGELEKTVAVLIGESTNSSQQQTPGIPPEDDAYDSGEPAVDTPIVTPL